MSKLIRYFSGCNPIIGWYSITNVFAGKYLTRRNSANCFLDDFRLNYFAHKNQLLAGCFGKRFDLRGLRESLFIIGLLWKCKIVVVTD